MAAKKNNIIAIVGVIVVLVLLSPKKSRAAAVALVSQFEGFRSKAYQDTGDVWTVGYGSTYNHDAKRPVNRTDTVTVETAERWRDLDIMNAESDVKELVKVKLNGNQLASLTSFVYNIGRPQFSSSKMLRLLNSGADKYTVANEFDRWIYDDGRIIQGLINRRKLEKQIFLS